MQCYLSHKKKKYQETTRHHVSQLKNLKSRNLLKNLFQSITEISQNFPNKPKNLETHEENWFQFNFSRNSNESRKNEKIRKSVFSHSLTFPHFQISFDTYYWIAESWVQPKAFGSAFGLFIFIKFLLIWLFYFLFIILFIFYWTTLIQMNYTLCFNKCFWPAIRDVFLFNLVVGLQIGV